MTAKTNVNPASRSVFFAENGNNNSSGASDEVPKLTMQAAIDTANAFVPPPQSANIARVAASQPGSFTQGFILKDFITFDGRNVSIITDAPIGVTLASFLNCEIQSFINTRTVASTNFIIDGQQSLGLNVLFNSTVAAGSKVIEITGTCDSIFISSSQALVIGDGSVGIDITSTCPNPIDIEVNRYTLVDDNTIFINHNPVSSTDTTTLNVSSVTSIGSNTTAFNVQVGELIVESSGSITAATIIHVFNGAVLNIPADDMVGDIIIDSGGTLNCEILKHTGTLTNNGTINGWINGVAFGNARQKSAQEFVLTGSSFNTQSPIGTNNPLEVEFGAAQFGPSDPIQMDILGKITINQTDQYIVDLVFHAGRTGAGSFAIVIFRLLVNGVQRGDSTAIRLDNANTHFPVEISEPLNLVATDTLTVEIWRDPSGFDAGSLFAEAPTLTGSNPVPSAAITITRSRLTQPV